MGEIDTKPIEPVQVALSLFGEKGNPRKSWLTRSNVRTKNAQNPLIFYCTGCWVDNKSKGTNSNMNAEKKIFLYPTHFLVEWAFNFVPNWGALVWPERSVWQISSRVHADIAYLWDYCGKTIRIWFCHWNADWVVVLGDLWIPIWILFLAYIFPQASFRSLQWSCLVFIVYTCYFGNLVSSTSGDLRGGRIQHCHLTYSLMAGCYYLL